ncbi:hypothetical protein POM88_014344 [Heracleum sosnowskyi]|uniref:Uncharacterized protein n=1 Tax=Heracleum sosnowskyi TaxID=360622 RepID=A0AAD8J1H3_9APIA|nr:hypothetical protein POM88_014344 [Heracleum sosnowskyi]
MSFYSITFHSPQPNTTLVFQLDNKLYALDTSRNPDEYVGSFEVYYPKQHRWHQLHQLNYHHYGPHSAGQLADPQSKGISFFSWFVFGFCVCLSLPKDNEVYIYYAKNKKRYFYNIGGATLPFPGMAITYCQRDFQEGGLSRFPFFKLYDKPPVEILDTKIYSQHDGDLTGCFTDFGNGIFCLTAFDNVDIYVHRLRTFSRRKCKNVEDLKIRLIDYSMHRYKYTDFSEAGHTSFSFVGCFSHGELDEEEDDVPGTECDYGMVEEFVDSDN